MKLLHFITQLLLVIGGINWGLALFDINIVHSLLGSMPMLEKAVYALVGISAIYQIKSLKA